MNRLLRFIIFGLFMDLELYVIGVDDRFNRIIGTAILLIMAYLLFDEGEPGDPKAT